MINYPPKGLVANLITPFDEDGRPDPAALKRLMGLLEAEVAAFLVGSLKIGEALQLDVQNRLLLLNAALESGVGERPIFFDVTGKDENLTEQLIIGADRLVGDRKPKNLIVFFLTPLIFHGNRDLPDYIRSLGALSRRRFILSNNPELVSKVRPGPHHKNIRTSVLKKLAANEQVVGMELYGDLTRAINYQRATKLRSGYRFYDGDETNFIDRPSSSGLVSCGANIMPQAWADIVSSSLNIFDAQRLYPDHLNQIWNSGQAVRSLMAVYADNPPAYIKSALKMMNVISHEKVAPETPGPDNDRILELKNLLKELSLI